MLRSYEDMVKAATDAAAQASGMALSAEKAVTLIRETVEDIDKAIEILGQRQEAAIKALTADFEIFNDAARDIRQYLVNIAARIEGNEPAIEERQAVSGIDDRAFFGLGR